MNKMLKWNAIVSAILAIGFLTLLFVERTFGVWIREIPRSFFGIASLVYVLISMIAALKNYKLLRIIVLVVNAIVVLFIAIFYIAMITHPGSFA